MSVLEFLQGKWLNHPLHPALVHVPVGLWPAALVFDIWNDVLKEGDNVLFRLSFWCIGVGCAAALVAVPPGLADWWEIDEEKPAYSLGLWHMTLNIIVLGLFIVNLLLRIEPYDYGLHVSTGALVLSAVGTGVLSISGYLGGRMVFDQGTGVARMSKKKWRRIAKDGGANVPAQKSK